MLSELYLTNVKLEKELPQGSYLEKLPAVRHLMRTNGLEFANRVTIFVGENGAGKSTLIEAIAIGMGFNPEGGTRNFAFSTEDSHSELSDLIRCYKGYRHPKDGFFLRAETLYNAASYIDELDREDGAGLPAFNAARWRITASAVAWGKLHGCRGEPLCREGALHPRRAGSRPVAKQGA